MFSPFGRFKAHLLYRQRARASHPMKSNHYSQKLPAKVGLSHISLLPLS